MIILKTCKVTEKWGRVIIKIYNFGVTKLSLKYVTMDSIILRKWQVEDAPALVKQANNSKVASNMRDGFPHPYNIEHAQGFIKMATNGDEKKIIKAIVCNNQIAGGIGAHFHEDVYRKNVELGYWLGETYWGRGIATFCIKEFIRFLFEQHDIRRIYAEVFSENMASLKVLEKAGFTHEATLRQNVYKNERFMNSCIYSILREELKFK